MFAEEIIHEDSNIDSLGKSQLYAVSLHSSNPFSTGGHLGFGLLLGRSTVVGGHHLSYRSAEIGAFVGAGVGEDFVPSVYIATYTARPVTLAVVVRHGIPPTSHGGVVDHSPDPPHPLRSAFPRRCGEYPVVSLLLSCCDHP